MATRQQFEAFSRCCANLGIVPSRHVLIVDCARQETSLFSRGYLRSSALQSPHRLIDTYRCSTSKFGIGETANSNMTPRGLHRIAEKIGGGWPVGTVFKSRKVVGFAWKGMPLASITTRIMWLEGLEPGRNRGGNVDSHARYIYIHGTGDEPSIGRPASHGCVQLAANDLIPLYDLLPVGTLVWITER